MLPIGRKKKATWQRKTMKETENAIELKTEKEITRRNKEKEEEEQLKIINQVHNKVQNIDNIKIIEEKEVHDCNRINQLDIKEENELDMIIKESGDLDMITTEENDLDRIISEENDPDKIINDKGSSKRVIEEENNLDIIIKGQHDFDIVIKENKNLDNISKEENDQNSLIKFIKEDINIDWADNKEKEINLEEIECEHGDGQEEGISASFIR